MQRIAALLRRITFGPLPEEIERAHKLGADEFIEEQLDFASIEDDAMTLRLQEFPTLNMTSGELARLEKKYTRPAEELVRATVLRAVYSRRQLFEQVVNFWSDHFNIHILKKTARFLKTVDDREVIRAHAMGNFPDLLSASMHSPAMLVYLDNVTSGKDGPNENYSRELLELHTLGVNSGFTQKDVAEVARALTGWSTVGLLKDDAGEFLYRDLDHDDDSKFILGIEFPAGQGVQDGELLIELLANHPSTASFIAYKLVRRFVSDTPPAALVARAATAFQSSAGNIRTVLAVILHSEEFHASLGLKLKRPFEYVISALRQTGAETRFDQDGEVMQLLGKMGQLPFYYPGPNGYPEPGSDWLNSNDLLNRWNFALGLAENLFPDTVIDWRKLFGSAAVAGELLDVLSIRLLGDVPPPEGRVLLQQQVSLIADQGIDPLVPASALLLASPYFQYR